MNKRQKKKLLNKYGYKCFYERVKNCKNFNDWFKLVYPNHLLAKLILKNNPFLNLLRRPPIFEPIIIPYNTEIGITFK